MAFPDEKTLKKMGAKLDKVEGTLMISPNATPLQKLRWDICQKFVRYTREHELTQDQLAKKLGSRINIRTEIDASLIGGVIVRTGDLVIDASVRGKLSKLSATLNS